MEKLNSAIIIPNWNGLKTLKACIESALNQSVKSAVILVENGSSDDSLEFVQKNYPEVIIVKNNKNLGFAGGVNSGIRYSFMNNYEYLLLLNNDAVAEKDWVKYMIRAIKKSENIGAATSKILTNNNLIDSVGNGYSSWGLPFPCARNEEATENYNEEIQILGVSGGASIYKVKMLKEIGLFDEDFFAYYEDLDLSIRAWLAGWKIIYEPKAIVFHQIGATSGKIKGFTTYQTIKNLHWLLIKNIPLRYLSQTLIKFSIAYLAFIISALLKGQIKYAMKGLIISIILLPKKIIERIIIQHKKTISSDTLWNLITKDLPPEADNLRYLRKIFSIGFLR